MTPSPAPGVNLGNTAAYREELMNRLGGRDRFEILEGTHDELEALVAGRMDESLRTRPFTDRWTPMEILGHLVDAELLFAYRTRTVLCDEEPSFAPIDQDRWAARQRHNERTAADIFSELRGLRHMNLRLWRSLSQEELARSARHPERGEESLDDMLTMLAGHDLAHVDQLARYLEATDSV